MTERKVPPEDLALIRKRRETETAQAIADDYGVSRQRIAQLTRGIKRRKPENKTLTRAIAEWRRDRSQPKIEVARRFGLHQDDLARATAGEPRRLASRTTLKTARRYVAARRAYLDGMPGQKVRRRFGVNETSLWYGLLAPARSKYVGVFTERSPTRQEIRDALAGDPDLSATALARREKLEPSQVHAIRLWMEWERLTGDPPGGVDHG